MKLIIKKISFILFFLTFLCCNDNVKVKNEIVLENLRLSDLPENIRIEGEPIQVNKWKDSIGDNILIVSKKGPFNEKIVKETEDEKYIELYIDKYVIVNGKDVKKEWRIYDFIRNCSFDMDIGLPTEKSVSVTDLDNDGVTETTIAYFLTCRSDVSPSKLKVIMYDKGVKLALRGNTIVSPMENINSDNFELNLEEIKIDDSYEGFLKTFGRYESEKDFINKDSSFLIHAQDIWKKNVIEGSWVKLVKIEKNNLNSNWQGNYSYQTRPYKLDSLSSVPIYYDLNISKDSIIFSGQGYQTNFYDYCYAKENADTLNIYYNRTLEGTDYNKDMKGGVIAKLFKKEGNFFIISSVIEDIEIEKDVPVLIEKED